MSDRTAYAKSQEALQPQVTPLQVDDAMLSLRESVEFIGETVRALLRRVDPVSVSWGVTTCSGSICDANGVEMGVMRISKAPLAESIDAQREQIAELTKEVQAAIRALQI